MKKRKFVNQAVAMTLIASMGTSLMPMQALAVTGSDVAADGTYEASADVVNDSEDEDEWYDYKVDVSVGVTDGVISDITVTPDSMDTENQSYLDKAYTKSKGIKTKLVGQAATEDTISGWDVVSGATCVSNAIKAAAIEAINKADEKITINTENLAAAITTAESLTEADYTPESWAALQTALTAAKAKLDAPDTQRAVDDAVTALNTAVEALEEAVAPVPEMVYGTVNLSYADYYYGELNEVTADPEMNLTKADPVTAADYRDLYDAVSSATTTKYKNFGSTYYTDNGTSGGTIDGIKDVNIAVPGTLYEAAKKAIEESAACSNKLLEIIGAMNVSESSEAPAEYKVLNGDGTLGAMVTADADITATADVEISTNSTWGHYLISVDSDQLPDKTTMEGVILTTSDGSTYGLEHLDNLWLQTGEIGLAVKAGFYVPQDKTNEIAWERFKDIQGKTITEIKYIVKGGADVVIKTNLLCKKLLDAQYSITGNDAIFADGVQTAMTITAPDDANYSLTGVSYGGKVLTEGTDYTYANGTLTIKKTDNTGIGAYSLTYTDAVYEDVTATVVMNSDLTAADIKIEDNKLVINSDSVSLADYINAISSVTVDDKENTVSGVGAKVFSTTDGSVDFDASTSFHGQTSVLFPEKSDSSYTVAVKSVGYPDVTGTVVKPEYQYVYAPLTWAEYWASEGVYLASGSSLTGTSDTKDTKGETDKGAFDTVSRATTNHGLHRGSFQTVATIIDTEGKTYAVSYWEDGTHAVLTDGTKITFSKGTITYTEGDTEKTATMDHYEVSGIKYVPVAVKTADYKAFAEAYDVAVKGSTLAGGYSENQLPSYNVIAAVDGNTNGLKYAVKNEDGTFSFTARQAGTSSGIEGTTLKTADNVTAEVKEANGSYGEFLRVDLTGDGYGALGSAMYAVEWAYYGTDESVKEPLAVYGTKFAADNWMHKSMGIQLGLTESLRCELPSGTDGTGKWVMTVFAMGYSDTQFTFSAASNNIVKEKTESIDTTVLSAAIAAAENLKAADYTSATWNAMQTELSEAKDELAAKHSQAAVDEAATHLNNAIKELAAVPVSYSVAVTNDGNGTAKASVSKAAAGTKVTLTATAKSGYHFKQWQVVSGGVTVTNNTFTMADKAVTVKAIFEKDAATVTVKTVPLLVATSSNKTVKLAWSAVSGATGYEIYGTTCGKSYKKLKTITNAKTLTWTVSNLKKGTNYKYYVRPYKIVNGKKTYFSKLNIVHVATTGGKFTNAKAVTTNFSSASLSVGKTKQITAKTTKVDTKKKLANHVAAYRYTTSNSKVATVTSKGKIKAVGKGTCYIYVYANNGVSKRITITVK